MQIQTRGFANTHCRYLMLGLVMSLLFVFCAPQARALTALQYGAKGAEVLTMQQGLKGLGYYAKALNSKYDKNTFNAVRRFQNANGLTLSGQASLETLETLYSDKAVSYSEYLARLADQQCVPGGKGSYVVSVQKRLKTYGYYLGKTKGAYDSLTQTAVSQFQSANALSVTGNADRATRALLNTKTAVNYATYLVQNNLNTLSSKAGNATQITYYQEQLVKLGYLAEATGKYDAPTIRATRYFQQANGLAGTGVADYKTRQKANEGNCVLYEDFYAKQQYVATKIGSQSLAVEILQTRLKELGYFPAAVSGKFDSKTKTALSRFQLFNNIPVTGTGNAQTLQTLYGTDVFTYAQVYGSDTLKKGMTGTAVKTMQTRLKSLGHYAGSPNGKYDAATVLAVKKFQKSIGYSITGIAFSNTLAKLAEMAGNTATNEENEKIEKIIAIAYNKLGNKYGHDNGPTIFDCCGFTQYCYKLGAGVSLPWTVKGQAFFAKGKQITSLSQCKRGDILIFENDSTGSAYSKYSHATLYLGNGSIIHASSSKGKVVVTNIKEGYSANYYQEHFIVGMRIFG